MFKQLIIDNQEKIKNIEIFNRDYIFYDDLLNLNKIVSFVGARRVGKTFLMFQFIKDLISKNIINYKQLVFIDFSVYRNEKLDPKILLDNYFEINNENEPFFVFDEVQDISNFTEFVLFFYNKGYKIFLSGSNSKLLSSNYQLNFDEEFFNMMYFHCYLMKFGDLKI